MAKKSRNDYYPDYSILRDGNGDILRRAVDNLSKVIGNANEKYRDTVFRMLVNDRKVALEIYNAMNDSDYDDPEEVVVTTLENAVYMGVRNDASFIIASQLVLYEQQSTVNPNMPLRYLEYVACLMAALTYDANIYGRRLIRLPEPRFVIFYNGDETVPERYEMRLSDAYEKKSEEPALELKVDVVNINKGYNEGLMEKSPTLYQYMEFVDTVRLYQEIYPFEDAMSFAIEHCIKADILADFLRKNRAEVLRMSIFVYDQEKHIRQEKDESREEGKEEGRASMLRDLVIRKVEKGYSLEQIADAFDYNKDEIEPIYNMVREESGVYSAHSSDSEKTTEVK